MDIYPSRGGLKTRWLRIQLYLDCEETSTSGWICIPEFFYSAANSSILDRTRSLKSCSSSSDTMVYTGSWFLWLGPRRHPENATLQCPKGVLVIKNNKTRILMPAHRGWVNRQLCGLATFTWDKGCRPTWLRSNTSRPEELHIAKRKSNPSSFQTKDTIAIRYDSGPEGTDKGQHHFRVDVHMPRPGKIYFLSLNRDLVKKKNSPRFKGKITPPPPKKMSFSSKKGHFKTHDAHFLQKKRKKFMSKAGCCFQI